MSEDEDTDIEEFERLSAAAEPHLKAAVMAMVPEEAREMAEAEYAEYGPLWLHGAMLAWTFALTGLARASRGRISLADLDEAMLPRGTTDDDLTSGAGGIIGGEAIREALKRFKASLPPDHALPEDLVMLMLEDGFAVTG